MSTETAAPAPPNFPITGDAARRLVQIRAQMSRDLGRRVTYTQVIERLLDVYAQVIPG